MRCPDEPEDHVSQAPESSSAPLDVLILDADCRQALAAARSFARAGRTVGLAECRSALPAVGFSSRYAALRAVLPDTDRPDVFVAALARLLRERPARVVIPILDGTVSAITARRAEILGTGAALALAPQQAVEAASDKRATLARAAALGVPIPQGLQIDRPEQISEAITLVGLPAVVKPARSWSDEGNRWTADVAVVESEAELRASTEALLRSGDRPIIQQWLTGRREAVHVVYAGGEVRAMVAVTAVRTYPSIGGRAVLRESIPLPADVADHAERLVRELGLEGYSEVEFRRDDRGVPVLMEINPRLSGSVEVAMRAGVDIPELMRLWASGEPVPTVRDYRPGVRLRWLDGDLRWIAGTLLHQGQPDVAPAGAAVAAFARDFFRPTSYDYFDLHDPVPVAAALRGVLVKAAQRVRGAGARS